MPSVRAESLSKIAPKEMVLNSEQVSALASYKKKCEITKRNLSVAQEALTLCLQEPEYPAAWWQTPSGLIGISIVSIAVGVIIGKNI